MMQTAMADQNAAFAALAQGLPSDVERMYRAGDFAACTARLDALAAHGAACPAWEALRQMIQRARANYTLPRAAALAALRAEIPGFREEEFDALFAAGRIDWRYIDGVPHCHGRFVSSLRLYPDMNARGLAAAGSRDAHSGMRAAMRRYGRLGARIEVEASVAPSPRLLAEYGPDAEMEAWLPVPAACAEQTGIEIEPVTPGGQVAPGDAPQRCVYWHGTAGQAPFTVRYRYTHTAVWHDMAALRPDAAQPALPQYLAEEAPHILFTPRLRALAAELCAGLEGPLARARAIYDYITLNVQYRYQPDYVCLEAIADRCAADGWGDCGVMALLFITLCRIAGVPARWQSGLSITPGEDPGAHDWAQFYLAPYGWLWADCSFGVAAHRYGDEARRQHYFGNLDPLRMVANHAFYAQLTPPDPHWRNDPYDNQTGEAVLAGRPLHGVQLVRSRRLLAFGWDADVSGEGAAAAPATAEKSCPPG